jgi:aspartyl-tRNA(Asn)/glutamyl-tRNA(Gln) amidotransferase subunit B
MRDWEAVIGLEVHAQLRTRSKIFCGCSTAYGAPPNTLTCPVCLGHPGALPTLNAGAVRLAVRAALALGCDVAPRSVFARKNYFYPDLPKGYQISQYDEPLASGGHVVIEPGGSPRSIGLIRLHLEEDAGKSLHDGFPGAERVSRVDLNRAGTPLAEIVSRPELRSPEEAYLFLERLRSILRYIEVCDGNLEEGSLRCDANVSLRERGSDALGTRTELKNLNSFRNVQRALEYEIERQVGVLASGGRVEQETVLWDAAAGVTRPMRGKEEAHDYRYFPEPDVPPVVVDAQALASARAAIPELPHAVKRRFAESHGLSAAAAHRLSLERPLAGYFEAVTAACGRPEDAANWILNDLLRAQNAVGRGEEEIPLPPESLAELISLVAQGTVSRSAARTIFDEAYATGRPPRELVRSRGLERVSDAGRLDALARAAIEANPSQAAQYRAGKAGLLAFFVGQVMRASGGGADPAAVREILARLLDGDDA